MLMVAWGLPKDGRIILFFLNTQFWNNEIDVGIM